MAEEHRSHGSAFSDARHRPQIRTFHPRRSRMTPRQRRAFESGSRTVAEFLAVARPAQGSRAEDGSHPRTAPSPDSSPGRNPRGIDRSDLARAAFGTEPNEQVTRLALEIGFGMGDATVSMAGRDPSTGIVAVDVHTPGAGALLAAVAEQGLSNVCVLDGDALELLPELDAGSLDEVRVYFPDPWPKRRHAKRRLVSPGFAAACARVLSPGGVVHVATDWEPYAELAAEVLADAPEFPDVRVGDDATLRRGRPVTRYERAGLKAGRRITEIVALRA